MKVSLAALLMEVELLAPAGVQTVECYISRHRPLCEGHLRRRS